MLPGQGVSAVVEGKQVWAGNEKLLNHHGIAVPPSAHAAVESHFSQGSTIIYIAWKMRSLAILSCPIRCAKIALP